MSAIFTFLFPFPLFSVILLRLLRYLKKKKKKKKKKKLTTHPHFREKYSKLFWCEPKAKKISKCLLI